MENRNTSRIKFTLKRTFNHQGGIIEEEIRYSSNNDFKLIKGFKRAFDPANLLKLIKSIVSLLLSLFF